MDRIRLIYDDDNNNNENKDHLDQTPLSDEQNKASEDQRLRTRLNRSKSEEDGQAQMMIVNKMIQLRLSEYNDPAQIV